MVSRYPVKIEDVGSKPSATAIFMLNELLNLEKGKAICYDESNNAYWESSYICDSEELIIFAQEVAELIEAVERALKTYPNLSMRDCKLITRNY